MKKLLVIALATSFFAMACKSEIDNKPAAEVTEVAEAAVEKADEKPADEKAETKADSANELSLIKDQSSIGWVGAKVTGDHKGGFKDFTGKAGVDADGNVQSVQFIVDTKSVFSDAEKLTGHLMSADFFDVEKFPKASFKSTKIEAAKSDNGTHSVTGEMTIREISKSITFPATLKTEGEVVIAQSEFTLKRSDFGIVYKGKPDDLIKEEVLMKIDMKFSKSE